MNNRTYLIVGGTGGIGRAMIEQLVNGTASDNKDENANTDNGGKQGIHVFATYHRNVPDFEADNLHWISMNICEEQSIEQAAEVIQQQTTHIDWIINCAGLLHTATQQPEKALRQVETDFFLQNMQVNALASLLIAKHFRPLLAKAARSNDKPAIFATISARVAVSVTTNWADGIAIV
ncbi:SDR family NAD(P)-dependent oxidoreductase [Psychrobacter sp. JCM 18903]|uniref:SDR family NAD(P)-dependent oxidoreductase n=1 Tax=Psychrobacter sp. JCM 18903 TaxID=1298610 RepID=UPI0004ACACB3|nr:SDR family NAD(P)-dependent oxidoreductase [Psychrobacter sp. JCM 18903]